MDTPAMCARTGWITRLLTWRRRGMVPASTAEFLKLRFKDSSSAQFSGTILLLLWWMFQTLEGHKEKDTETLRLRLTRQMIITQTIPQTYTEDNSDLLSGKDSNNYSQDTSADIIETK